MVSDRRCKCKGRNTTYFLEVERECGGVKLWSKTTYFLNVEREHDEVRLWRWKQSEQDDVPPGGKEGASWYEIVDEDAKRARQRTN